MKNILFFCFLLLPSLARADYAAHHITFILEMRNGEKIKGYNQIPPLPQADTTVNFQDFIRADKETALQDYSFGTCKIEKYRCYKNRIAYRHTDLSNEKSTTYHLLDPIEIDIAAVKSFRIKEVKKSNYQSFLATKHTAADRAWMQYAPQEYFAYFGGFCATAVYIHESNPITFGVVAELNQIAAEYAAKLQAAAVTTGYIESEYNNAPQKIARKIQQETERKIEAATEKLAGEKAVVVKTCGC